MAGKDCNLGPALREFREARGILAKDLAATADVSASYVSEVETGKRNLSKALAGKVAPEFGMELEEFWATLSEITKTASSGVIREDEKTYHFGGASEKQIRRSDAELLAIYFLKRLTKSEAFELIHKFTNQAATGDKDGFALARALLDLLPITHPD